MNPYIVAEKENTEMKKILCAAFLLVLLAQPALAAWTDEFTEDFDKFGLDTAVENALDNEVKAVDILTFVVQNRTKFSTKMSLKALYCAGQDRDVVRETASKLGVAVEEISKALQESIAECGSKMALQDRDVEKVPNNGNLSGKAPQQARNTPPQAQAPAAQKKPAALIDTPRRRPSIHPSPSNP
jgi:hypothetical protein